VELYLHPAYVPSWRGQGELYLCARQSARSAGRMVNTVQYLNPVTDGSNVGRISKGDAGAHLWPSVLQGCAWRS
jgi:hypothetical protein